MYVRPANNLGVVVPAVRHGPLPPELAALKTKPTAAPAGPRATTGALARPVGSRAGHAATRKGGSFVPVARELRERTARNKVQYAVMDSTKRDEYVL